MVTQFERKQHHYVKNVELSSSFPIQLCICIQKKIISNYVCVYGNLVRAEEK